VIFIQLFAWMGAPDISIGAAGIICSCPHRLREAVRADQVRLAGLQTGEDGFDFVQLAVVEFGVYTDYLDSMQQTDPAFYAVWEEGSGVLE